MTHHNSNYGKAYGFANNAAKFSDPNLTFTTLLMGFEGADGSQEFVDESPSAKVDNSFGLTSGIRTARQKWGVSSFQGTSSSTTFIEFPDSSDWHLGTSPFSIEAWVRNDTNYTGVRVIIGQVQDLNAGAANSAWVLWYFNGTPYFSWYDPNTLTFQDLAGPAAMTVNAWNWVAVSRNAAGRIRLRVGTNAPTTADFPGDIRNINQNLMIANSKDRSLPALNTYLDEIRLTKGVDLFDTDAGIAVPTAAYARS